jgi:hypothetical protein
MEPMKPMEPMQPMSGGESWWPDDLGQPSSSGSSSSGSSSSGSSSSGSQNGMRYAFFADARRLLIEQDGKLAQYDSGDHRITGVSQQHGDGQSLTFTSQHGRVELGELKQVG